jgi:hypothetical protein
MACLGKGADMLIETALQIFESGIADREIVELGVGGVALIAMLFGPVTPGQIVFL